MLLTLHLYSDLGGQHINAPAAATIGPFVSLILGLCDQLGDYKCTCTL